MIHYEKVIVVTIEITVVKIERVDCAINVYL